MPSLWRLLTIAVEVGRVAVLDLNSDVAPSMMTLRAPSVEGRFAGNAARVLFICVVDDIKGHGYVARKGLRSGSPGAGGRGRGGR